MGLETEKTWPQVERICGTASAAGFGRHGILVAVGGGITLDLAGTAASLFRRGIGYVRVPTTLVGLVDVAVGIKHGINAFGRKNILGSFYPPLASVSDYSFLRTLPVAEIACGFAEIVKVALVRDEGLFEQIEQHGRELLHSHFQAPASAAREIALRAELLMMEELAPNLFESNLARLVDFGHTFSPTIETATDYRISHGKSVALDLLLSTVIAANKGICEPSLIERLFVLLCQLDLPVWDREMPSAEALCVAIQDARRHRGGALNLVVPCAVGAAIFLQDVGREDIQQGLDVMYELTSEAPRLAHREQRKARYASACV
jgi:3-dehydroquinate synthase